MCAHDEAHAMGIVVNRPKSGLDLGDVLSHLGLNPSDEGLSDIKVLDGGPVTPDRGVVLHSEDARFEPATQDVAPGVRMTTSRDILEAISEGAGPERFVLALGAAVWGPGQLEQELAHNAWLVADASDGIVFGPEHQQKWGAAIRQLGLTPAQIPSAGGMA
jgi:putative transcriptional regulator